MKITASSRLTNGDHLKVLRRRWRKDESDRRERVKKEKGGKKKRRVKLKENRARG